MKHCVLFFAFLLCVLPVFSYAQLSTADVANDYYISLVPSDPQPDEKVQVELKTHFSSLRGSIVEWSLDGKKMGTGTLLEITAPSIGKNSLLRAVVTDTNGNIFSAETLLSPIELSLLTDAVSLTPPLYKGKRFGTAGTSLIAHALAKVTGEKGIIPESALIYTWSVDGKVAAKASGLGKRTFSIASTGFAPRMTIEVTVEGPNGERATRSTSVSLKNPVVVLYENSPLFGMMIHTPFAPENMVDREEVTVSAFPYFATVQRLRDSRLQFAWEVNNVRVQAAATTPEIVLGAKSGQGAAQVKVGITDSINYLFETAGKWAFTFNALSN